MSVRRFPNYEPGNATRYDVTLAKLPNGDILLALWPGLHCSACLVLSRAYWCDASADYLGEKLRVTNADAEALLALIEIEVPKFLD